MRIPIAIFLMLSCLHSFGQDRPKVGLVLSGGGARGMAHVGVIKVLEEEGIIPDYITGTSMGSIIGGLYAIGYSPEEIDSIAVSMDWDRILSNQISLSRVAIEEKGYSNRYIFDLPVDGIKPGLPKGVIEGQGLTEKLSNLTRPAHSINNFDNLPIPFRCVATDIETGERVVLKDGFLPEALRASMAIPSIFTPVEIDGRLLVDGGLVRNFPVQEVLDMGADIVIGVFVSDDLMPKEKLNNMVDVLMQSAWVMSTYDTREQRKLTDLYVEPYLEGYSTYSFKSGREIIDRGYNTTDSLRSQIKAIKAQLDQAGYTFEKPVKKEVQDIITLANIRVEGNNRISDKTILGKLRISGNTTLSVATMENRINEVYGTGYFEKIEYDLRQNGDKVDLTLNVIESIPRRLKLGLHYNNEIRAGVTINVTLRNTIVKNSRFVADINLAENTRADINFLKYLGARQNFAFVAGFDMLLNKLPFYSNEEKLAILNNRFYRPYAELISTYHPNRSFGAYASYELSNLTQDVGGVLNFLNKLKYRTARAGIFWKLHSLDKQYYPKRGNLLDIRYEYAFSNSSQATYTSAVDSIRDELDEVLRVDPHHVVNLTFKNRTAFSDKVSLIGEVDFRYASVSNPGVNNEHGIGGFYKAFRNTAQFWGAELYEFQTANALVARLGLQWMVVDNIYLLGIGNYLNTEYPMQLFNEGLEPFLIGGNNYVYGGGFGIGYMSRIGPVELNIGKTSNGPKWRTGFNVGFLF